MHRARHPLRAPRRRCRRPVSGMGHHLPRPPARHHRRSRPRRPRPRRPPPFPRRPPHPRTAWKQPACATACARYRQPPPRRGRRPGAARHDPRRRRDRHRRRCHNRHACGMQCRLPPDSTPDDNRRAAFAAAGQTGCRTGADAGTGSTRPRRSPALTAHAPPDKTNRIRFPGTAAARATCPGSAGYPRPAGPCPGRLAALATHRAADRSGVGRRTGPCPAATDGTAAAAGCPPRAGRSGAPARPAGNDAVTGPRHPAGPCPWRGTARRAHGPADGSGRPGPACTFA